MFYTEIINCLRTDGAITATVTLHNGLPAIFSDEAPEECEKPYIVLRIDSSFTADKVVATANLYVDYYDYGTSRVVCDGAAIAIENRLEQMKLRTENITDLRFSLLNTGYIPESDPRTIHHNSTFSCRGARSGWMKRTKTT